MSPVPVVGIAESAMLTALMCGGRFAIVTWGRPCGPFLKTPPAASAAPTG